MYVLQLMDHYSAGFCVLVIAIIECIVISWIYGRSISFSEFFLHFVIYFGSFSVNHFKHAHVELTAISFLSIFFIFFHVHSNPFFSDFLFKP